MKKISLQPYVKLQKIHAASGLVKRDENFYVIADDSFSLATFSLDKAISPRFKKLIPGELPSDFRERKKLKPDWEALMLLPLPEGKQGLLVVPSGSKAKRQLGILTEFKNDLEVIQQIDFSLLYKKLEAHFAELNIEGAVIFGDKIKIFQRGNGLAGKNAVIDLDLVQVTQELLSDGKVKPECILNITEYELGTLQNVNLSFTDACTCSGNLFFLAAAEAGKSTYEDGQYIGAILGRMNSEGVITERFELDCPFKPEGLWIEKESGKFKIYIVTDADDSELESSLYIGELVDNVL